MQSRSPPPIQPNNNFGGQFNQPNTFGGRGGRGRGQPNFDNNSQSSGFNQGNTNRGGLNTNFPFPPTQYNNTSNNNNQNYTGGRGRGRGVPFQNVIIYVCSLIFINKII